ncbi:ABC transporter substrate-binding protein [Bosea sp. (in: a-proteobacteria)]|jgi:peptide/nickel transport system substrate-binding protein|uniref:ABC transporter substrate-binding protein n=1 Tax=Bosea sp. (in: a-proteobacteria) TaxID=1871050 RepID=UPI003F71E7E4
MKRSNRILAGAILACLALPAGAALAAKDKLTVDLVGEPNSLDPHVQWNPDSYYVYRNIFDNLLTRDDKGEIVPQIATSWKYLSDTQIQFQLRDDVTFHDGSKLTAEDVVYSVKRITDPKFASPQLGQFDKITDAVANDAKTVTLTTNGAYPALLAQLVKLSIVPKAIVEQVGKDAFNLKPVGSGPYKFEGWQRGVSVTLARNDAYWGQKGAFPSAVFRAIPDAATRVANLQAGAADLVANLDGDLALQLKNSARAKPVPVLTERVAYLAMNVQKEPLNDPKVRLAIAHAIDKQAITEGVLGGYEKPMPEMLSPAHTGWVEGIKDHPYDLAKAKALLTEAGPKAKQEIALVTAPVYDQRVVQALQQMLNEAGLTVKIEMTDMGSWLKRMQAGPDAIPAMAFSRWSCGCQDADGVLFPILHSSSGWANAKDKVIDEALEGARQTLDAEKRLSLYRTVHERVAEQNYIVPLYQASQMYGTAKNLEWTPTPNESIFINRMKWKD